MSESYSDINNYEFKKTIGEGNFAKVKLSIFKPTNEEFAIKIINKIKLKEKMRNTLFRETEVITKLKHPNIITVIKMIEDSYNYYIVMENCRNGELFDYIVHNRILSENESSLFFYQLINGVEYIHSQNFVHRDLKPENLLLTENNILKIIDFGLSHPFDGTFFLKTKCGSPSYAAPEIIKNAEYDGFKTDIWSCGVILYAMLCGFLPFDGENDTETFKSIIECNPQIPEELSKESKKLIKKIFTPNPNERINIPEIKKTNFYLKGKELFKNKYLNNINDANYSPNNKNIDIQKELGITILKDENKNENHKIENNNNNNPNNITIDEDNNNNFEAITIASNDEDIDVDLLMDDKKGNNINIFDINKLKKIKAAQTNNVNNINNKDSHENENINKDNNDINLQTYGNEIKNQTINNKLQLNFNNNLRNNNNHILNSFRKKLINLDLNQKIKQKFDNFQKIMKTEANEYKIDAIKTHTINLNNEDKINNKINIKNLQLNEIMPISNIPSIKDKELSNNHKTPKRNYILKLTNSHKTKNILNSNHKTRKIIEGKSPFHIQHLLSNNQDNKRKQTTSFNRFLNNLASNRINIRNISNRRNHFDTQNSKNKNSITDNTHLNTISANKIYLYNKTPNSRTIEVKKNNNNNNVFINKCSGLNRIWQLIEIVAII